MATRKFYIGSHGPFYYEDADLINDPDGDFAGLFNSALTWEGGQVPGFPTGASGVITVLTQIQAGGVGPVGAQYKNRSITVVDGIVTIIGAESGWNDI